MPLLEQSFHLSSFFTFRFWNRWELGVVHVILNQHSHTVVRYWTMNWGLFRSSVLGDSHDSLRDCMLGQFTRQQMSHQSLDITIWDFHIGLFIYQFHHGKYMKVQLKIYAVPAQNCFIQPWTNRLTHWQTDILPDWLMADWHTNRLIA